MSYSNLTASTSHVERSSSSPRLIKSKALSMLGQLSNTFHHRAHGQLARTSSLSPSPQLGVWNVHIEEKQAANECPNSTNISKSSASKPDGSSRNKSSELQELKDSPTCDCLSCQAII